MFQQDCLFLNMFLPSQNTNWFDCSKKKCFALVFGLDGSFHLYWKQFKKNLPCAKIFRKTLFYFCLYCKLWFFSSLAYNTWVSRIHNSYGKLDISVYNLFLGSLWIPQIENVHIREMHKYIVWLGFAQQNCSAWFIAVSLMVISGRERKNVACFRQDDMAILFDLVKRGLNKIRKIGS